ncbi:MAG TPA: RES domain-containing protein [Solirubrobacterales bacterium]
MFRNTPFGVDAWQRIGEPARYTGRFHGKDDPLPLYAADSYRASLMEHELHTAEPLHPEREVLRRVTALAIASGTHVLLGDHLATLEATGLTLGEVYHPTNYSACHQLIEFARSIPDVVAVSTQSNADRPQRTLAILPEHVHRITGLVDYWEGSLNLLKQALIPAPVPSGQR